MHINPNWASWEKFYRKLEWASQVSGVTQASEAFFGLADHLKNKYLRDAQQFDGYTGRDQEM